MNPIGERLSAQHEDLDRQLAQAAEAARARDWALYGARLADLRAALLEHMAYEEEELFPVLETLTRRERERLSEQHVELRTMLDTLSAASPEYDPDGCLGELERLAAFQVEHHARELAACYPQSAKARVALPPEFTAAASQPPPLDLRGLQPPEPIVRIFAALERAPRRPLRAILPHEPVPLYALLRERGFTYTGSPRADGGYELLIEGDS